MNREKSDYVDNQHYNFQKLLVKHDITLPPVSIETLQVNITKQCNQICRHCHVDASPNRTEHMDVQTVNSCLEVLKRHNEIRNIDITGGAPELNPNFDYLVIESAKLNKRIMVRHNLTIQFEINPNTGRKMDYLPEFFAKNKVEIFSSLPYYQEYFTDKQRGKGVFKKSIEALRLLNEQGYGKKETELKLNLIYNPAGAFLPASQESHTKQFKQKLYDEFGIEFNDLYTITNIPINRFRNYLLRLKKYSEYMERLVNSFNSLAAEGIMCRSLISVGYDGKLYDCDFNQMLGMQIEKGYPRTIFDFNYNELLERQIQFKSHCFSCTAGLGSSCCGETS